VKDVVKKFLADESGATAIEYGLIAAGISLAIISVVNGLGTNLRTRFTSINTSLRYAKRACARAVALAARRPPYRYSRPSWRNGCAGSSGQTR